MNIGKLRHRLTIAENQKVSDGQGGFVSDWVELGKVWADAKPMTPRERFYRGEEQHTQGMTFTVRQNQSFLVPNSQKSDKLRIEHRGNYFRVIGIAQDQYNLDFYIVSAELFGATVT
jgi:SPP1 family predicted phage head-tail adaptor